jgi:hypothetical protein
MHGSGGFRGWRQAQNGMARVGLANVYRIRIGFLISDFSGKKMTRKWREPMFTRGIVENEEAVNRR